MRKLLKITFLILILIGCNSKTTQEYASPQFGFKEHAMNKTTSNLDVLRFWDNNSLEQLELYEAAYNVLSVKGASYTDLLSNEKYVALSKKYQIQLLGGPMLGDIKGDGVTIWLRTSFPSKVQIALSTVNSQILTDTIYTEIENDLTGLFPISGLMAGTTYSYEVILNDSVKISNENYLFKTLPNNRNTTSTRIAFGSCTHRWGLGNSQMFATIKRRNPLAMLLLGDIAVQDRNGDLGMHRADYLLRDFQTGWSDFVSGTPVYASWDDHDYFANDKSGIPEGYSDQDRRSVRQIFKNSWSNPYYGQDEEGIYFKTTIGLCDIIMTDNKYFVSEQKDTFLGHVQMEWLKKQITNCQSPFLIMSCGTMWSDYVSKGKESWGEFDPDGREEIFNMLEEKNISGVLLISGDRHGARGFTIERESGFKLYEFEVASLGSRVGDPKSKPEWKNVQMYGIDGTFAFGEFTFTDSLNSKDVVFRLIKEDGEILYSKKLSFDQLVAK